MSGQGEEVVFRLSKLVVKSGGYTKQMDLDPIADVLFLAKVPESGVARREGEEVYFNLEGIRSLVKSGLAALVLDSDADVVTGDF